MTTTELPSLPAGMRWKIKHKRAWAFLALQKETWWGWKTVRTMSLNPSGMSFKAAVASCAYDILDADTTWV